jgi:nucleoside-diphosphate-sugar epimerase
MEILVTGGNGFVGRHLLPALQERGDSVRVLALPAEDTSWLEERSIAVYRGDVRQPETLVAPMRGVEGVVHLAAMMGVWRPTQDYYAVNVTGTEHVCRAALKARVRRVVHISSAMVYRLWVGYPVTEDAPLTPLQEPYAATKAEGDKLVQRLIAEEGLPAVIIRPGTVFGPGDRLNFGRLADRVRAGKGIIVGAGRNAVPFVFVTDLVQGLILALDHSRAVGHTYNIGNDQPLTQEELLGAIAEEIGAKPPRIRVPYHLLYSIGYALERASTLGNYRYQPLVTRHGVTLYGANNRLSIDKAWRELGYVPRVPIREGVRLTAAWYRQQESRVFESGSAGERRAEDAC